MRGLCRMKKKYLKPERDCFQCLAIDKNYAITISYCHYKTKSCAEKAMSMGRQQTKVAKCEYRKPERFLTEQFIGRLNHADMLVRY